MKTQILEKLNDLKSKSGKSYEKVHDDLGFSASTVQRWHKGIAVPDIDDLTTLVEYYGGSMHDLFAAVGQQEMTATQAIGYQGADVMVEHYETKINAEREKYALLMSHHTQAVERLEKSVEYLKADTHHLREDNKNLLEENARLRSENTHLRASIDTESAKAGKHANDIVSKKHYVYRCSVILNIVLSVAVMLVAIALIIAFKTDAII